MATVELKWYVYHGGKQVTIPPSFDPSPPEERTFPKHFFWGKNSSPVHETRVIDPLPDLPSAVPHFPSSALLPSLRAKVGCSGKQVKHCAFFKRSFDLWVPARYMFCKMWLPNFLWWKIVWIFFCGLFWKPPVVLSVKGEGRFDVRIRCFLSKTGGWVWESGKLQLRCSEQELCVPQTLPKPRQAARRTLLDPCEFPSCPQGSISEGK